MSKPAGICLPAGFPRGSKAPSRSLNLNASTTIFLVLLLLRDLLTLSRLNYDNGTVRAPLAAYRGSARRPRLRKSAPGHHLTPARADPPLMIRRAPPQANPEECAPVTSAAPPPKSRLPARGSMSRVIPP